MGILLLVAALYVFGLVTLVEMLLRPDQVWRQIDQNKAAWSVTLALALVAAPFNLLVMPALVVVVAAYRVGVKPRMASRGSAPAPL